MNVSQHPGDVFSIGLRKLASHNAFNVFIVGKFVDPFTIYQQ